MYDNIEDYILDRKVQDKNCSYNDVSGSTKKVADLDKDDGVTCEETPPHDESEEDTHPNPDRLTIMSKKSKPEGSPHVEKVNNEYDSQAAEAAILVSNEVPQPVSNVLTQSSGQTSLVLSHWSK